MTVTLYFVVPPFILDSPSNNIRPVRRDSTEIYCSVYARPTPKATLLRDDVPVFNTQHVILSHTLTNLNFNDSGTYTCLFDNGIPPELTATFEVVVIGQWKHRFLF